MTNPTVSIVIPASDAAATIGATLNALGAQSYVAIVDIVVAAADRETANAAARAGVTVIDNPSGTTPAGLNLAIHASRGEVIVRVDAHAVVPPDYVARAVSTLQETGAANVGGMQIPVGQSFWSRAVAAAMASPAGSGYATYRSGGRSGPTDTVYLGTYLRETILGMGGFDESFRRHQDFELNERIRASGGTVWFDSQLRVEYRPRSSLRALVRQYFDYGSWKRRFASRHPGRLRLRQILPPALVVVLAASIGLGVLWREFLLIPGAYALSLILVGLASIPRAGMSALGVPVALAAMHISWGTGFLIGGRPGLPRDD